MRDEAPRDAGLGAGDGPAGGSGGDGLGLGGGQPDGQAADGADNNAGGDSVGHGAGDGWGRRCCWERCDTRYYWRRWWAALTCSLADEPYSPSEQVAPSTKRNSRSGDVAGVDPRTRGRRLEEVMQVVKELRTGHLESYRGRHFAFGGCVDAAVAGARRGRSHAVCVSP